SGTRYRAIAMGPIPSRYDGLYEFLMDNNRINIQEKVFSDDLVGEQFLPDEEKRFSSETFSKKELEVLNQVAERFQQTTTKEIIEISHQEKAWQDNHSDHNLIDYRYSFDLKDSLSTH
ncbi:MAG: SocA family protein, partial [Bacteroidales bacterium]|nr:SocA family protein [Bacteroidales bacterium]